MIAASFSHVRCWVFDLDNTLYPPSDALFAQMEPRIDRFIAQQLGIEITAAGQLRRQYWQTYGTTLTGLMTEHNVAPAAYMEHVHDVDMSHMQPDIALRTAITALPGRKIVYTNGHEPYAQRVLTARGLSGIFDAIYGLEHADYLPKPAQAAFEAIFALDGLDARKGAMFEDDPRNLTAPHAMGMRTVHVAQSPVEGDHVHHHTNDLAAFLSQVCA